MRVTLIGNTQLPPLPYFGYPSKTLVFQLPDEEQDQTDAAADRLNELAGVDSAQASVY
jgi:hypothetical protein